MGRLEGLLETGRRLRDADLDGSRSVYSEAAELARLESRSLQRAHALRHLSDIDREAGRLASARAEADEAVTLYRTSEAGLDLANALRLAALTRDDAEARPLWAEAHELYRAAGVDDGAAECEQHLAPSYR